MYEQFAHLYDWEGSVDFAEQAERRVAASLRSCDPAATRVLDVACGTGTLAVALAARGFPVTGIDLSDGMLRQARAKAEARGVAVELVRGDMRDFVVDGAYDVALCTCDALNHLLDPCDFERTLVCVARALAPGGRFFFDLNTRENYAELWRGTDVIEEAAHRLTFRSSWDPVSDLATTVITAEEHGRILEETVRERCYDDAFVRAALARAGFVGVRRSDWNPVKLLPPGVALKTWWSATRTRRAR